MIHPEQEWPQGGLSRPPLKGVIRRRSRWRGPILLVSRSEVMINRDSWGHSYLTVRGEILGFVKDGLLRKHLPRMFSFPYESMWILPARRPPRG